MKQMVVFSLMVSVLTASIASKADENVVAFWDFKAGEAGEAVSTIKNSSGSGSFTGTVKSSYTKPVFSATNVRKRIYTDSTYGEIAVEDAQSLFFNYKAQGKNCGAFIDISGLGTALSKLPNYTVEMFLRYESVNGFRWPQVIAVETASGSWYVRCGKGNDDCTTEVSPVDKGGTVSPGEDVWFHIAIVYTETDSVNHTGERKFYYNGSLKKTHTEIANVPTDEDKKVRLGYYLKDEGGNESYCYRGEICALRIKSVALEPQQFLALKPYDVDEDGTVALMTLEGKTAGESAAAFALDASDAEGVSQATGSAMTCDASADTGVLPLYDADVPGKYLFSSRDRSEVLSSDWRSLKFTTEGAPNTKASSDYLSVGGGLVTFANLSSAISAQKSYTIEMFVKDEDWSEFKYARGVFAFDSLGAAGTTQRNSYELSTSYAGSTSWNSSFWVGVGNTPAVSVTQTKAKTWKDGAWHHVAIVYDGEKKEATTYIDYAAGTPKAYTNAYLGATGYPLYLGASRCSGAPTKTTIPRNNYCFRGKVAGLRIVPRMLEVTEFMVADDSLEPSSTVFALNFEEGRNKIGTKISETDNAPLNPYSAYTFGWVYKFLDSSKPEWSDKVSGKKIVKWGETVVHTNETAMHLCGLHSATDAEKTAQKNLTGYAGTVLARFGSDSVILEQNPKSWTLEGYFKMEYTDETIPMPSGSTQTWAYPWSFFGKAGCPTAHRSGDKKTPQTSWGLTVSPTVRSWCLTWTEDDGKVDPASEDPGTGGVSHSKTFEGTAEVLDKRWHHVAVTYDADKKQFELFVDHISKGTAAVGTNGPLWDGPYDYCFGRGVGGQTNLEGWMDEIRFSNKVLTPEEMVRLEAVPGLLILLR